MDRTVFPLSRKLEPTYTESLSPATDALSGNIMTMMSTCQLTDAGLPLRTVKLQAFITGCTNIHC